MSDKSLLIIDDDVELTDLLSQYLTSQNFQVDVANDSEEGLGMAVISDKYDLILLDVMMPKLNGFDVLKKLRQTCITPVLMLTAKGDDFDRILGLELGADDYLPKPFNHRELTARINAIVRRVDFHTKPAAPQNLTIDKLTIIPSRQEAFFEEESITLTGTEFAILHLLMANRGELVSKESISEQVFNRKLMAFDRSIDMHVSNIRKKIHQFSEHTAIKTVRGSGYIFVGAQ
ncbi:DNA-binding response regulator [Thalassotalea loyana]|uniref:DNA-binding response regulator n=1 Tax=Thalassotalea loyana TaxID=280483 RepID=A0ABQ6H9E5_9GAMM|nr:response regulator [Thalassotalea loyana]GLX84262.1 DNA-binding response regulator [Thalassotalea loyana]